jgi:hypothetical protein
MDRRGVLAQQMQRLDPVGRGDHRVPGVLECVHRGATQLRLVFHHEHGLVAAIGGQRHLFMRS